MEYRVLIDFSGDGKKDGRSGVFRAGDPYPAPGFQCDPERIEYLCSKNTSFKKPVIELVASQQPEPEPQDHIGEPTQTNSPRRRSHRR